MIDSVNRSFDPGERRGQRFRKLTEVSRALTYLSSLEEVAQITVDRAADLVEADWAVLMLRGEDGLLHVRAAHGVPEPILEQFQGQLDEGLVRQLLTTLCPAPSSRFLGVPLVVRSAVTGLLAVAWHCGEEEEWLLAALADQAAVALENAKLDEEVRRELEQRVRTADGTALTEEKAMAVLAHDLRSPLHAIESYIELLRMEILGPLQQEQRETLEKIRISGRHILALVENVLEMARLSAGVLRVKVAPVPVAEVIEEALLMVHPEALAKGQILEATTAPELVAHADPLRLREVLVNLSGNAIKYTPPTGRIRISASLEEGMDGSRVVISVSDTGPGIPPDQLEAIFQPYYRLPDAAGSGSGLGLAISRELVRRMGGELQIESQLGCGSTFVVQLERATR